MTKMNKICPIKMNYVIYCRKSQEAEDRQAASIEDQLEHLRNLARENNFTVVKEFTESMTAKAPGRPVFNEMISYIRSNPTKGIIVWNLNRVSRNPVDDGTVRWLLQNKDLYEIVTPHKTYLEYDSDYVMAFEGVENSRFIKKLTADTLRGIQKKIKAGIAPHASPPGYRNAVEKPQGLRDIVPHDTQFILWKNLFHLAVTGTYTVDQLYSKALQLNIKNRKDTAPISRSTFYETMANPLFYTGKFEYAGVTYQGIHKPMLSDDEYALIRKHYGTTHYFKTSDHTRAFNGLIQCVCGNTLTGESHRKNYKNGTSQVFIYYRCCHCKNQTASYISLKSFEAQVKEYLSTISISDHYVKLYIKWLNIKNEQQKKLRDIQLKNLQRQASEVIQKLDNLVDLYISPLNSDRSLLSDEDMKQRKAGLLIEKEKINKNMKELDQNIENLTNVTIRTFQFATKAVDKFENGTILDKRTILRAFGSNLQVDGKKLVITLRRPFELIQRHNSQNMMIEPKEETVTAIKSSITPTYNPTWGPLSDSIRTYLIANSQETELLNNCYSHLQI